ncbi:expressed unknown protein [Seminavis robusta]|uniref:Uncharacterized protein n=1 Tax=Seminavis robusta TaxID=568900 RepID=A0A9N8E029_9STRA|nr:expressed unknown protein [Seminavis robusta]|eukprot:Sro415_g138450.1 n/a (251) ;mRNA; r:6443-7195
MTTLPYSTVPLSPLAMIPLVAVIWFVLPLEYRDIFVRHAVILVGLWQLAAANSATGCLRAATTTTTTDEEPPDELALSESSISTTSSSMSSSMSSFTSSRRRTRQQRRRQVSFGAVEILEFPTILGDNPSTREGASVTLDWKLVRRFRKHVDYMPERTVRPRAVPSRQRELLLLSRGYSFLELDMAAQRTYERQKELRQAKSVPNTNTPFLAFKSKVRMMVTHRRRNNNNNTNSNTTANCSSTRTVGCRT